MPSGLHRLKLLSSFAAVSALRPMMMSTAAASVSPPIAKRVSHTVTFGKVDGENRGTNPMEPVELQDDLFWIRDDTRKNEEVCARQGSSPRLADWVPGRSCSATHTFEPCLGQVLQLLREENDYSQQVTAHLDGFRGDLYNEMLSHVLEVRASNPNPNPNY